MRYNKIRKMDISNGLGIRVSIFVQGCTFNCRGCFNPETHNFDGGKEFTEETLSTLMKLCESDKIRGLSILGGEALHENNLDGVLEIVETFKAKYPNKDIWLWSGFKFEEAIKNEKRKRILENIDYMIDGQFEFPQRDLKLKWAGSRNQRFINVKESLKANEVILAGEM